MNYKIPLNDCDCPTLASTAFPRNMPFWLKMMPAAPVGFTIGLLSSVLVEYGPGRSSREIERPEQIYTISEM